MWSIVGTPNEVNTVRVVAVDVATSGATAHEDVPASCTVTVMSWDVPVEEPV